MCLKTDWEPELSATGLLSMESDALTSFKSRLKTLKPSSMTELFVRAGSGNPEPFYMAMLP